MNDSPAPNQTVIPPGNAELTSAPHSDRRNHLRSSTLRAILRNASAKGVFHLFAANAAIGILAFGAQLLVVKFLSPVEMGYLKTLQSFIAIAALLAGFGFNTAVVKLCSEKNTAAARAYIFKKCFTYALVPIAGTLVLVFVAARLGWLSPVTEVNRWMPIYMWTIPGFALTGIAMLYLQATKQIKVMATTQTLTRLAGAAIIVAAAFVFQFSGFIYATVIINSLALLPLLWLLRRDLRSSEAVPNVLGKGIYYARWGLAANIIQTIGANIDILLLNFLWPNRGDLGFYGIATILLLGLNQITGTVQNIATPYFSEKSDNRAESWRVLKKYQGLMIGVAAAATLIAIMAVPTLVSYFYGSQYSVVGEYFRILALKYLLWSCYALSAVAILGAGQMRLYTAAVSVSMVVTLILSYFAIPAAGPTGAAMAQVLGSLITLAIVTLMIRRLYSQPWELGGKE